MSVDGIDHIVIRQVSELVVPAKPGPRLLQVTDSSRGPRPSTPRVVSMWRQIVDFRPDDTTAEGTSGAIPIFADIGEDSEPFARCFLECVPFIGGLHFEANCGPAIAEVLEDGRTSGIGAEVDNSAAHTDRVDTVRIQGIWRALSNGRAQASKRKPGSSGRPAGVVEGGAQPQPKKKPRRGGWKGYARITEDEEGNLRKIEPRGSTP